jgi:hypothetical protein
VLPHRSILSTVLYAKDDQESLRPLARPWPGSGLRARAEEYPGHAMHPGIQAGQPDAADEFRSVRATRVRRESRNNQYYYQPISRK